MDARDGATQGLLPHMIYDEGRLGITTKNMGYSCIFSSAFTKNMAIAYL